MNNPSEPEIAEFDELSIVNHRSCWRESTIDPIDLQQCIEKIDHQITGKIDKDWLQAHEYVPIEDAVDPLPKYGTMLFAQLSSVLNTKDVPSRPFFVSHEGTTYVREDNALLLFDFLTYNHRFIDRSKLFPESIAGQRQYLNINLQELSRQIEDHVLALAEKNVNEQRIIKAQRAPEAHRYGWGSNHAASRKVSEAINQVFPNGNKDGEVSAGELLDLSFEEMPVPRKHMRNPDLLGAISYRIGISLTPRYLIDGKAQVFYFHFTTSVKLVSNRSCQFADEDGFPEPKTARPQLPYENQLHSELILITYTDDPESRHPDKSEVWMSVERFRKIARKSLKRPFQGGAPGLKSQK